MKKYVIEEEWHCSLEWEYNTFQEALDELKRRSEIPWNIEPNKAPCMSWESCSKLYVIIEYDISITPYIMLDKKEILEISSKWVDWKYKITS